MGGPEPVSRVSTVPDGGHCEAAAVDAGVCEEVGDGVCDDDDELAAGGSAVGKEVARAAGGVNNRRGDGDEEASVVLPGGVSAGAELGPVACALQPPRISVAVASAATRSPVLTATGASRGW